MTSKEYQKLINPVKTKKQSKYRNVKTEVDGIKFDSLKEAKRYKELKELLRLRLIEGFECQVKYPYEITYSANGKTLTKKAFYKSDFHVYHLDGSKVVEDVKGRMTDIFKRKAKIIKALYGIEIVIK